MSLAGYPAAVVAPELYIARAKKSGTYPGSLQSIANSSETTVTLDAYDFTRQGSVAWQTVSNTITPPVPGIWQIRAYALFWSVNSSADTTGGRQLVIKKSPANTVIVKGSVPAFGPLNVATACACEVTLDMSLAAGGTYAVFLTAYQTSGVSLNVEPYLVLEYKGP